MAGSYNGRAVPRAFRIVDVFTDRPLAGNQLAVVLDGDGMDPATMQAIAREFNFSETTFVTAAGVEGCDRAVRIFTPTRELPVAGHPIVGTALVLHDEGMVGTRMVLELGIGPTPVEIDAGNQAWMTFPPATFGTGRLDPTRLASAVTLANEDVRADLPAQVVSCGNEFVFLPLA